MAVSRGAPERGRRVRSVERDRRATDQPGSGCAELDRDRVLPAFHSGINAYLLTKATSRILEFLEPGSVSTWMPWTMSMGCLLYDKDSVHVGCRELNRFAREQLRRI